MGCGGPGCERGRLCLFVGSWANVWTSLWFGSFLASPRGTTVASEFEVLSSVAHGEGERSKGNKSRISEDSRVGEMRRLSCFQAAASGHLLPHAGIYTTHLEADLCRASWVACHDWVTSQEETQSEEGSLWVEREELHGLGPHVHSHCQAESLLSLAPLAPVSP